MSDEQRRLNSFFTEQAEDWESLYGYRDVSSLILQERRERLLGWIRLIEVRTSARVLDVGCGAGTVALAVAQQGYRVTALDPVPAMLERTHHRARALNLDDRVLTTRGNVRALPFASGTFEVVYALGVLSWLKLKEGAISEMVRVLQPGGWLIVTGQNRYSLARWTDPLRMPPCGPLQRWVRRFTQHPTVYTLSRRQLDRLLRRAQLTKVLGATFGFGPFTLFQRGLFSETTARLIHERMQNLADRQIPFFRALGNQYITLTQK